MVLINESDEILSLRIKFPKGFCLYTIKTFIFINIQINEKKLLEKQETRKIVIRKTSSNAEGVASNSSFGFSLWFNNEGHFVDDVTIGGQADNNGLKPHDMLIKVILRFLNK